MQYSFTRFQNILWLLVAVVLLSATQAHAAIQAVFNHNIFFAAEKSGALKGYLELYWQIDPNSILYNKEDNLWKGKVQTDIMVSDENGIVVQEHYILASKPSGDVNEVMTQKLIDLRRFQVPSGHFTIEVALTDLSKKESIFRYTDSINVPEPDTVFISGIQLIDTILNAEGYDQNVFQRNNMIQFPLCTNFIDDKRKSVKYYAEIYQADKVATPYLICKTFVSRKNTDDPSSSRIIHIDTLKAGKQLMQKGQLSTASLPSGNYYVNMVLLNNSGQVLATQNTFFQLINTQPVAIKAPEIDTAVTAKGPTYLNLEKTFVAKYTASQIRAILKMLLPIADPNEKRSIYDFGHKPDDMYSRYFIYNFWLSRNKLVPEEEWKKYTEKVKEVNKLFGSNLMPGYETERGAIYLKYGAPTERIKVENESGALPYEVWQYDLLPQQTNGLFLFYKAGIISNDYRLLHTTVNGEIRNRNWRTTLYINNTSSASTNSTAEQFFGNR